jgi:hypothetical protein
MRLICRRIMGGSSKRRESCAGTEELPCVHQNNEPVEEHDILLPGLPAGARLLQHVEPEHKHAARGQPAAS